MTAALRLSLGLDPGRPWPHLRALARRADAAGWHAVYVCDHFMPHDPAGRAPDGPMLEGWTVLAALATQTAAIRLGSLVLGATYRHPVVVASMGAALNQISHGRAVLGIGAGWQPNEHAAYGIALPAARDRIDALSEACAVLRSRLGRRIPLLVGGGGARTLRVVARHADAWHTWADPAVLARKNAVLDRHCLDLGRDPADIARATGGTVAVRSALERAGAAGENDVQGTAAEVLDRLLAFRDAGAGEFIVSDAADVPVERALGQLDLLTEAVLPGLTR